MNPNGNLLITLLTDFGDQTPYVAEVKGKLLTACPDCRLIDLSHKIKPYDIEQAAGYLDKVYSSFPKGTVHIISVEPIMVTLKPSVLVKAHDQIFIAPNNGVLSYIIADQDYQAFKIKTYDHPDFKARDLYPALVASWVNHKTSQDLLQPICSIQSLLDQWVDYDDRLKKITGKVTYIDHFGNAETNINEKLLKHIKNPIIVINRHRIDGLTQRLGTIPENKLGAFVNDCQKLEIAMLKQSAAKRLKIKDKNKLYIYEKNIT